MKFKTPCFVRVENVEEREALLAWCATIGYATNSWLVSRQICCVFAMGDFAGRSGTKALQSLPPDAIDCGTDVDLFKALAAMNDENDRDQWFIDKKSKWFHCERETIQIFVDMAAILGYDMGGDWFRKATAEEIVEHFKSEEQ